MAEEVVRIMCPKLTCKKVLAVPASVRGKTVICRACSTRIKVPDAKPSAAPASEPDAKAA